MSRRTIMDNFAYLEDVKLSAAVGVSPAGAGAVLLRSWYKSVEHPDRGLVASRSVVGHRELEEENLGAAFEAMVCGNAGPVVATSSI